jgi:hypothetical protein
MRDGTIEHLPFDRAAWEEGLANPLVRSQWTHGPGNCSDQFFEALKAKRIELAQSLRDCPLPPVPVRWPPESELQPWMLQQMTTLGADDARAALAGPRKQEPVEKRPVADRHGQFSLF